jgi:GT2 family glycosyltransferase
MNLAARRATLLAVGGFDERLGPGTPYPAAEDNDLGHRLLEAGHQITYEPRATVHHRAWRSRSEQTRLHRQYGRGQGAFYAKHLALRDPYMVRRLVDDLRRNLVRVPRSLAGRTTGPRGRELAYLSGVASGMTRWLATHGRASRRRVRG